MKRLTFLILAPGAGRASARAPYPVPEPKPVPGPILVGSYDLPGHFNAARWAPMARAGLPYPLPGYHRTGAVHRHNDADRPESA